MRARPLPVGNAMTAFRTHPARISREVVMTLATHWHMPFIAFIGAHIGKQEVPQREPEDDADAHSRDDRPLIVRKAAKKTSRPAQDWEHEKRQAVAPPQPGGVLLQRRSTTR